MLYTFSMKKLLVLLFCFIGTGYLLRAQTSGWETGINLSGGYSFSVLSKTDPEFPQTFMNLYKKNRQPALHYSAGVYGRKFFKGGYGVEVGLQYTSFATHYQTELIYSDPNDPVLANKPNTLQINDRQNYMELPIRFVFKKDFAKIGIGCFAGIAPAILTDAYSRSIFGKGKSRIASKDKSLADNVRTFNLFADVGLLLRVPIGAHFALDIKPFARISVLPVYGKAVSPHFDDRFVSAGLSVSSVYRF